MVITSRQILKILSMESIVRVAGGSLVSGIFLFLVILLKQYVKATFVYQKSFYLYY